MDTEKLALLRREVQEILSACRGSHDWDHTERVFNLCRHLGAVEGADPDVLGPAALLHDIGREHQDRSKGLVCHAELGAGLAREILLRYGLAPGVIDHVVHCIETHRFRGRRVPASLEAKVLFDADKLDSIGAVGIGRAFLFAGEVGARLHNREVDEHPSGAYTREDTAYREFIVKLRRVKDRMLTDEGRRMAEERHLFMVAYFDRLNRETAGDI
jgi:uncharacterized protein